MSLERRLRDALRTEAAHVHPDVEGRLDFVRRRSARRAPIHPLTLVGLAAAVILILVIRAGGLERLGAGPSSPPGPSIGIPSPGGPSFASAPTSPSYPDVAGTYSVTLTAAQAGVTASGLAGTWTMTLEADGVLDVRPPAGFRAEGVAPSGNAFTQTGTQFRTNLFYNDFCSSIGSYSWTRSGGRLTLTAADDTCVIRRTLLATLPWQEVASTPTP